MAEVVAQMGCSRRLADLYFKESFGHTVLDEIHIARLAYVKDLLGKPACDLARLAEVSGYSSNDDLRRVFKKRIGCTLREYRQGIWKSK